MATISGCNLAINSDTSYSKFISESSESDRSYSSSTLSSITIGPPIPREVCDVVFHRLHNQLRTSLNFHEVWPFLNLYQLLSPSMDQTVFTDPTTTLDTKIDILVSNLPKCECEDYLSVFVLCLRKSAKEHDAGEAHEWLAEEILRLCRKEMKKDRKKGLQCDKNHPKKYSVCRRHYCIIGGTFAVMIQSVLFIIGIILFLKIIPYNLQKQALFDVLGSSTIPLDKSIRSRWIKSVDLQWNFSDGQLHCKGEVAVITGRNCLDLHFFLENKAEEILGLGDYIIPFYALPGSSLTVSIPDSDNIRHKHVWITRTLDEYLRLSADNCRDINYKCQDICFKTNDYINSSIVFNVTRQGYYFYYLTNDANICYVPPLTGGIRYFVNISTFNYTTISNYYKQHSIYPEEITENRSPKTIQVSRSFKFDEPSCPLLNIQCFEFQFPKYTMQLTSWKPRTDIVYMLIIFYFLCVCLDLFFVLLWFCIKHFMWTVYAKFLLF